MKTCSKCDVEKDDAEFEWESGGQSGVSKRCNECRSTPATPYERMLSRRAKGLIEARYPIRDHALLRYWQRVRPDAKTRQEILREMIDRMETAEWTQEPPDWYVSSGAGDAIYGRGYLRVSASVVLCLADYHDKGVQVSTVLVQWPSPPPPLESEPVWVQTIRRHAQERIERTREHRARAHERAHE